MSAEHAHHSNEQDCGCGHDHGHDHEHGGGHDVPHYHIRELRVREDIMAKANELADLITTSEEVDFYRKAEAQIQGNKEVQELITLIKKRQKEAVAFEHTFKNPDMVKKIEAEIDELQDKLDGVPIVNQFKQAQDDLNYLLQLIVNAVRDTVSEKIDVEGGTAEAHTGSCNE